MNPPIYKKYLQDLSNKAVEKEKKLVGETEEGRMKRLLIKSSVDSILDMTVFHAKIGNIYYCAENLSKSFLMDIYDNVKLMFPDCKILLNLRESSITIHWG